MIRRLRGTEYRIRVDQQPGTVGRVRSLVVDGVEVAGNVIPLPAQPGGVVEVSARIEPDLRH